MLCLSLNRIRTVVIFLANYWEILETKTDKKATIESLGHILKNHIYFFKIVYKIIHLECSKHNTFHVNHR